MSDREVGLATNLAIAEYQSLRAEILKSIEIQFQVAALTVVAFGSILSVSFTTGNAFVALIFPFVAFILNVYFLNHAYAIGRCASYIRALERYLKSEEKASGTASFHIVAGRPQWETVIRGARRRAQWLATLDGAVFALSGIMAVISSVVIERPHGAGLILFVLSALIAASTVLLSTAWRRDWGAE